MIEKNKVDSGLCVLVILCILRLLLGLNVARCLYMHVYLLYS
jgi:hypothetical protein